LRRTDRGTAGDVDIWIATRQGNGRDWGMPLNLVTINSTSGDRRPSFSPDGEMILFDSDRPGGSGSFDLYVSTRKARPER
jgi:Tol biopolymer transport system component